MISMWPPDLQPAIAEQNYDAVAQYYEQAIDQQPDRISHYWYLGLAYLLQHREEDAQATWFTPLLDASAEQSEIWSAELAAILHTAAQEQLQTNHPDQSWLIRGYLREMVPDDLENRIHFVDLSLQLQDWTPEDFEAWDVPIDQRDRAFTPDEQAVLLRITERLLTWPEPHAVIEAWIDRCFHSSLDPATLANTLWVAATNAYYSGNPYGLASYLAELGLTYVPNHLDLLGILTDFYVREERYQAAIAAARRYYENCHTPALRLLGSSLIVKSFLNSGNLNTEAQQAFVEHQSNAQILLDQAPTDLDNNLAAILSGTLIHFAYYKDRGAEDYRLQNQLLQLCEQNIRLRNADAVERYKTAHTQRQALAASPRKLRIGYLTKSLRLHSVGWLSRWLFRHHNRDAFEILIYFVQFTPDDFTQTYFAPYVDQIHSFGFEPPAQVAEKIFADQVDILIDLDSLTSVQAVNILSLRPAPVQVTWLGWDATGLSSVDYFIADSYVVPETAQDHYQENLWKLPQTYVAVEGFEIGVPTLRRDRLGIPPDAVVYLSAQKGCKRHPDNIRAQMQILKGVPHSYFLIKGLADEKVIQDLFAEFAATEGVDPERIRFLPRDEDELTHRANLQIADIVLDTFPYNGATTTLEVLWLGIPLVTRVGNQFSARNSYGFLKNAGVDAGIAWSDREYVEWGIRLGLDHDLREQVSWQLKRSRQTAPLWNARQFTQEMEQAYQHMWERFLAST